VYLRHEAPRGHVTEIEKKRAEEKVRFQDNLKSRKKNYYVSKGVGRFKWLPGGTQNKRVLTVIF
jgi:hypothetical protein